MVNQRPPSPPPLLGVRPFFCLFLWSRCDENEGKWLTLAIYTVRTRQLWATGLFGWIPDTDVSVLLPEDEDGFDVGVVAPRPTAGKAALEGTEAALRNPSLVSSPDRSLFASAVQAHCLWGAVAWATLESMSKAEQSNPDYQSMVMKLNVFEGKLPSGHVYDRERPADCREDGLDLVSLAFFSGVLCIPLSATHHPPFFITRPRASAFSYLRTCSVLPGDDG